MKLRDEVITTAQFAKRGASSRLTERGHTRSQVSSHFHAGVTRSFFLFLSSEQQSVLHQLKVSPSTQLGRLEERQKYKIY